MKSCEDIPALPTSIAIDEDGDLTLILSSKVQIQCRILVTFKVPKSVSKVLKAMLSKSKFEEGRELARTYTYTHPKVQVHTTNTLQYIPKRSFRTPIIRRKSRNNNTALSNPPQLLS